MEPRTAGVVEARGASLRPRSSPHPTPLPPGEGVGLDPQLRGARSLPSLALQLPRREAPPSATYSLAQFHPEKKSLPHPLAVRPAESEGSGAQGPHRRVEPFTQAGAGAVQSSLDGILAQVQAFRRLGGAHLLDFSHHENRPVAIRQRIDCGFENRLHFLAEGLSFRIGTDSDFTPRRFSITCGYGLLLSLAAAEAGPVPSQVHRDLD